MTTEVTRVAEPTLKHFKWEHTPMKKLQHLNMVNTKLPLSFAWLFIMMEKVTNKMVADFRSGKENQHSWQ